MPRQINFVQNWQARIEVEDLLEEVGEKVRDNARSNARRISRDVEAIVTSDVESDFDGSYIDVGYDRHHPGFVLWWHEVGTSEIPPTPHLRPAAARKVI